MPDSGVIRIILIDDHHLVRESLSRLLMASKGFEVVAQAGDAKTGVEQALRFEPDMVLLDIDMPGMCAFAAAKEVSEHRPETAIVFLSGYWHDGYITRALEVDASGYLIKSISPPELIAALTRIGRGGFVVSREVRPRIVNFIRPNTRPEKAKTRLDTLSAREREILCMIGEGKLRDEIAQSLGLARRTVSVHITSIMRKLDIHKASHLVRFAIREGLVEFDAPDGDMIQRPVDPGDPD
ncbi:MAG: response regulator transcription factor [Phycisphaeraceae bacterium]|nr:response regulator transcription factor [Phycisphaeraceae bacterium]